jgi:ABC-type antimicrobial peptide transport system permease subunit
LWASIRQSVIPVLIGVTLGVAASLPATYAMRGVLAEQASLADAPLVVGVILTIVLASVGAALVPARRALSISPSLAMRDPG